MNRTLLIIILILSGIVFVGAVMMMSAKGGLGMGIGGMSGAGDYGSKKSIEKTLKKAAMIALIIFMISVIWLPYTQ